MTMTDAQELRVDYYAGALAMFAVIMFAKFVTHRGNARADDRSSVLGGDRRFRRVWIGLHWACVVSAWLGVGACLGVLGWDESLGVDEGTLRVSVAVLAGISASILALDVARGYG
jgi:hypothetical protein